MTCKFLNPHTKNELEASKQLLEYYKLADYEELDDNMSKFIAFTIKSKLENGTANSVDFNGVRYTKADQLRPIIEQEQNYLRKNNNPIELNKALVKEKWYQKLFRSFSDYKYKYEIENTPPKK